MNHPVEIGLHSDDFDFSNVNITDWLKTVSRRTRRGAVVQGCKIAAEKIEELESLLSLTDNELLARVLDLTEALEKISKENTAAEIARKTLAKHKPLNEL